MKKCLSTLLKLFKPEITPITMLVKIHKSYRNTITICDPELIGKNFEEGDRQLKVLENFYRGEEKEEKEILEIIEMGAAEDYTFNIVGEKSIALALKAEIITEEGVVRIQGVPIALVLL